MVTRRSFLSLAGLFGSAGLGLLAHHRPGHGGGPGATTTTTTVAPTTTTTLAPTTTTTAGTSGTYFDGYGVL